ncbi:MAG: hypothetical protein ACFFD8_07290 [Candidatus Thorarchaeota archaeon]
MEPSTFLPLDGLTEGYGLRDDALDQMLMTTGYREITLQYRSAINTIQEAFSSDTRLRVIALPLDDEQDSLWPHMAWMPLWSNRDTCVLIADPLQTLCHHDLDYLIPHGFAQYYAHTIEEYPYYLPQTTPELLWPKYLDCHPITISPHYVLNPKIPHEFDDTDPTIFSLTLEAILRLRAYISDHLLLQRGFATGVAYQYMTLLYELPLPAFSDTTESPWQLSFLLIDIARAVITLRKTEYVTWTGLRNLIDLARGRLRDLDQIVGNGLTILTQFDQIHQFLTNLQPLTLRDPMETNGFLYRLLEKAGVFQEDT